MVRILEAGVRITLVILAAMVLAAGAATAGGRLSGEGEAQMKNTSAGTVAISGQLFHVTERTVIEDEEGNRLKLRGLPVAEAGDEDGPRPITWVAYQATEVRGKLVLQRLELQPVPQ
jgi:hypothetical protein